MEKILKVSFEMPYFLTEAPSSRPVVTAVCKLLVLSFKSFIKWGLVKSAGSDSSLGLVDAGGYVASLHKPMVIMVVIRDTAINGSGDHYLIK